MCVCGCGWRGLVVGVVRVSGCGVVEVWKKARVLTRDWRSRARRAKQRPHDVLPHPRQGAIGRGVRMRGRELASRGAVDNAVASRRFCSVSSVAPASEREREEEEGRGKENGAQSIHAESVSDNGVDSFSGRQLSQSVMNSG